MNSSFRSVVIAALLGSGLAGTLTLAACQSIQISPTGGITIKGIDGVTITAIGLEDALAKCIEAKKAAEARGDKTGAADWQKSIENIVKEKGGIIDKNKLVKEGDASGTVTETKDEKGGVTYTWVGDGASGTDSDSGGGSGVAEN